MILLCSRALAVLINASGERVRDTVCTCTGVCALYVFQCVSEALPFNTNGGSVSVLAQTFSKGCESFFCAVCHSINCRYRALPGLRLISQCEQSLSAQTPTLANPAWLSMAQQDLATLLGPKGKHASA